MAQKEFKTSAAKGAAQLRQALKENWPGIKFSVTSDTYSMGDSIGVSWNFGPTEKVVKAIVGQWQDGHYNSMEDMYEHGTTRVYTYANGEAITVEDVKYTSTSRGYRLPTDPTYGETEAYTKLMDMLCKAFGREYNGPNTVLIGSETWNPHNSVDTYAGDMLRATAFPSNTIEVTGIKEKEGVTGWGNASELYTIEFTDLAPVKQPDTKALSVARSIDAANNLTLYSYSEKAFAVIGDTRPIKDTLAKLGGSFNGRLTQPGSMERVAGWIFSKKKEDQVRKALNL